MKTHIIVTGLFCFVVFLCAHVRAQETRIPELRPSQLGVEVKQWTVEDGLPIQGLNSLAQTPDGLIWCGSQAGLLRFDGVRFEAYHRTEFPGLDGMLITKLLVDGEGSLWLVGKGGEMGRFDRDRVTRFDQVEGFPEGGVVRGAVDEEGRLWLGCVEEKAFLRHEGGDEWTKVAFKGVDSPEVDRFSPIGDGSEFWFVPYQERALKKISDSGAVVEAAVEAEGETPRFGRFFRFPDGGLGVTSHRGNFREEGGVWRQVFPIAAEAGLWPGASLDGAATQEGSHWMADNHNGLLALSASGRYGKLPLGIGEVDFIPSLIRDKEGNIWVAKSDGLFRLRPTLFRNYSVEDGLTSPWIDAVAEDNNGGIWAAAGGNVYRLHRETESFYRIKVFGKFEAMHLFPLSEGRMLVAARNGSLQLWSASGISKLPKCGQVNRVVEDLKGNIWIAHENGLSLLEGHRLTRIPVSSPTASERVEDVRVDSAGTVFVIVYTVGVFQQTEDGWKSLSDPTLGWTNNLTSLYIDEQDQLWASTRGNHLTYYRDGSWKTSPAIVSQYSLGLRSVWSDGNGSLWIPSYRGVHQFDRRFALGQIQGDESRSRTFYAEDGLGSNRLTNSSSGILGDSKGNLWVATQAGLSVANLEKIEADSSISMAKPMLEKVILDQSETVNALDALSGVKLTPRHQLIELQYTATGLNNSSRGRFRYRMGQSEGPWIEVGEQRKVSLAKPQPGNYTFELQARNSRGIWGNEVLRVPVAVQPVWWDTLPAKLFLSSFLLLGVALIFFVRQKQVLQKHKSMEEFSRRMIRAQEEERRSVADELHDTIGQELIVLKAQVDLAKQNDRTTSGDESLSGFSQSLSKTIQLVKELSRGLRPALLEQTGLHSALATMINEVSSASSIPMSFSATEEIDSLGTEEQIGVFRIMQEILNNIVHHSDASEAEIEIQQKEDHFSFRIFDDGRGFDSADKGSDSKGSGLASIARRVSLLSGTLEIDSKKGKGTCITFQVPPSH